MRTPRGIGPRLARREQRQVGALSFQAEPSGLRLEPLQEVPADLPQEQEEASRPFPRALSLSPQLSESSIAVSSTAPRAFADRSPASAWRRREAAAEVGTSGTGS